MLIQMFNKISWEYYTFKNFIKFSLYTKIQYTESQTLPVRLAISNIWKQLTVKQLKLKPIINYFYLYFAWDTWS